MLTNSIVHETRKAETKYTLNSKSWFGLAGHLFSVGHLKHYIGSIPRPGVTGNSSCCNRLPHSGSGAAPVGHRDPRFLWTHHTHICISHHHHHHHRHHHHITITTIIRSRRCCGPYRAAEGRCPCLGDCNDMICRYIVYIIYGSSCLSRKTRLVGDIAIFQQYVLVI